MNTPLAIIGPSEKVDDFLIQQFLGSCRKHGLRGFTIHPGTQSISCLEEEPGQLKKLAAPTDLDMRALGETNLRNLTRQDLSKAYEHFPFYFNLFFDTRIVSMLDTRSRDDLFFLAIQCSLDPTALSKVQFRIGFGIHDGEDHSARLPAYIYPVVEILKRLHAFYQKRGLPIQKNLLPQVLLYSAANSVVKANHLNRAVSLNNRDYHFRVLQRYIETQLPPEFRTIFSFKEDEENLTRDLEEKIATFSERILRTGSEHPVVQKIVKTAQRHGTSPQAGVAYGLLHAVYSKDDGVFTDASCVKEDEEKPVIIMMGGAPEVDYWRLRRLAQKEDPSTLRGLTRIQIIQTTGVEPPYHQPNPEDISVSAALSSTDAELSTRLESIRRAYKPDYAALRSNGMLNKEALTQLFITEGR